MHHEVLPQVAQLAHHGKRQCYSRALNRRWCVQRVIDEIAHKSCKDPIVGAVPVQVGNGHGALAVPAQHSFLSRHGFPILSPPSLHDVVHLQVKPEAPVPHRATEQIAAVQGCGAIKSTFEVRQDAGEECKLSRALFAFRQHISLGSVVIALRAYLWTKNVSSMRLA